MTYTFLHFSTFSQIRQKISLTVNHSLSPPSPPPLPSGEEVERSYTPVLPLSHKQAPSDGRTIQFMIKLYSDGQMSQYLSQLKVGKCGTLFGQLFLPVLNCNINRVHNLCTYICTELECILM